MSVYKPKGSPYFHFDFVWKGRRVHGSTGLKSKRDAVAYENRERQKLLLPSLQREPITVDEACGLYAEHAEHLPSWPTARYMLAAMVEGLGGAKLLSEVSQRDLQVHFARRRAGRSNASVNREIEVCRAVWRRAERTRYDVGEMPHWLDLMLDVPEQPPRELSLTEEPQLFGNLRADLVDVCDFALKAGWRQAEVMGLRWSDCDLQAMQAVTRIKGGATVRRALTPTLIAIIANQPKVGPFVFTYICQKSRGGRRAGERYPMTKTALRGGWAAAKVAGGVEGFRFHDLRHTRGTRIVRATGSLAAAKEALKHRNIRTTLRYAHVLDSDVRHALDASESRTIPEVSAETGEKPRKTAKNDV
jgi:integrase